MTVREKQNAELTRRNDGAILVPGHTLVAEGAAFDMLGKRVHRWTQGRHGRAMCSCGELSKILPTKSSRQRWHRAHKLAVVSQ
jgi:hypothetical protein